MSTSSSSESDSDSFETQAKKRKQEELDLNEREYHKKLCTRMFEINNETEFYIKIGTYDYFKTESRLFPNKNFDSLYPGTMNLTLDETKKFFKLTMSIKRNKNKKSFYIPISHNYVSVYNYNSEIKCTSNYKDIKYCEYYSDYIHKLDRYSSFNRWV